MSAAENETTGAGAGIAAGKSASVDCGWGRLIFGQTFSENTKLAKMLSEEASGKRDIAMYLRDPHVVISLAPQEIFLDPSHTYRLWLDRYRPQEKPDTGFRLRFVEKREDAAAMHALYLKQHMVSPEEDFIWENHHRLELTYIVAEHEATGDILGAVLGVDHHEAFSDPEDGSSLWALVVDPQAPFPGIGEALVRGLAEYFRARGRTFMDLSVMHNNENAIRLYEKLGFRRVVVFALKHKNPYNEPLYTAPRPSTKLNPYAEIIVNEARRRGIGVDILDAEAGYFELSFGGRSVICRESLSELTTAIAMSRCDDKAVTQRLLKKAGLRVPAQQPAGLPDDNRRFLSRYSRVVVKPARGEQGNGISVDIRDLSALATAIDAAKIFSDRVLLEEYAEGQDLRIIVIDFKVVAAAIRRPPTITGTGRHKVLELIEKQSRRRQAATGGESRIPLDGEAERCIQEAGYQLDSILPQGVTLTVRKTANLHTGGTIHDVTEQLHPELTEAAVVAARTLGIPVVGLDFLVPSESESEYVIVEANERPGLANHEPQPTAERFVDLLFPYTSHSHR